MNKFKPSNNFVEKVMTDVRIYELAGKKLPELPIQFWEARPVRWAISSAGVLIGAWNIIRLYLSLVAPVVCR